IASQTCAERRQAVDRLHRVTLCQFLGRGERIAADIGAIQAHPPTQRLQTRKGVDAKEGIATKLRVTERRVEQGQSGPIGKGAAPTHDGIGSSPGASSTAKSSVFMAPTLARGIRPVIPGASGITARASLAGWFST